MALKIISNMKKKLDPHFKYDQAMIDDVAQRNNWNKEQKKRFEVFCKYYDLLTHNDKSGIYTQHKKADMKAIIVKVIDGINAFPLVEMKRYPNPTEWKGIEKPSGELSEFATSTLAESKAKRAAYRCNRDFGTDYYHDDVLRIWNSTITEYDIYTDGTKLEREIDHDRRTSVKL